MLLVEWPCFDHFAQIVGGDATALFLLVMLATLRSVYSSGFAIVS